MIKKNKFQILNSHPPQGNISLIMLFVLAIGSIMGLMSTHFLQSMIRETSSLRQWYQAYYTAKAGIELGTLAVNRYDYGFEDTLTGSSDILSGNMPCLFKGDCEMTINVLSRFAKQDRNTNVNTNILLWSDYQATDTCISDKVFILNSRSSYIFPLFTDNRRLNNSTSNMTYSNIINNYNMQIQSTTDPEIGVGMILGSWFQYNYETQENLQALYLTGKISTNPIQKIINPSEFVVTNNDQTKQSLSSAFGTTQIQNTDYFNYLAITNNTNTDLKYCLSFQLNTNGYPLDTSVVQVYARYRDSSLSLQWNIKKILPDYIYNTAGGVNWDQNWWIWQIWESVWTEIL